MAFLSQNALAYCFVNLKSRQVIILLPKIATQDIDKHTNKLIEYNFYVHSNVLNGKHQRLTLCNWLHERHKLIKMEPALFPNPFVSTLHKSANLLAIKFVEWDTWHFQSETNLIRRVNTRKLQLCRFWTDWLNFSDPVN